MYKPIAEMWDDDREVPTVDTDPLELEAEEDIPYSDWPRQTRVATLPIESYSELEAYEVHDQLAAERGMKVLERFYTPLHWCARMG